ncbi:hypothetical protein ACKWTF_014070 [Chironomus riparius]
MILFLHLQCSAPIDVKCDFSSYGWTKLGSIHTCSVQNALNIVSRESANITSINGSQNGKNYSNVIGFVASSINVKYFPRGLSTFFNNLIAIYIYEGRLKELNQQDLKLFPKLLNLKLWQNDIKILDNDLFEYNLDLQFIDFENNKIFHIGTNVFDKLVNLSYLWLSSNKCINTHVSSNVTKVKKLVMEIKNVCQN